MLSGWLENIRSRRAARKEMAREMEERRLREIDERMDAAKFIAHAQRSFDKISYEGTHHIEIVHMLYRQDDGDLFFVTTQIDGDGEPLDYTRRLKPCSLSSARAWLIASGNGDLLGALS